MKIRAISALLRSALLLLLTLAMPLRAHAEDWLPISQEDLAMKDNPKHKGDHAMILWREMLHDDVMKQEEVYVRIKVFDESGRDSANVETEPWPADVAEFKVNSIRGRTIHPDGSIVPFNGKVFERTGIRYRTEPYFTKTFALSDVTRGSIIEYKYTISWGEHWVVSPYWPVQDTLFQRKAHFSFRPAPEWPFRWVSTRLPANHIPVDRQMAKGEMVVLDIEDMPGYEKEDLMPPEDEVRARVNFFYFDQLSVPTVDGFWKGVNKKWLGSAEGFMGKSDTVERELASLIGSSDSSTVKLQKIYDRVQSFHNLTYAPEKTEQEIKRDKQKDNKNVDDLFRNGYGWHDELNWTFVALARGAGFDATLLRVAARDRAFFDKGLLDKRQLTSEIVLVRDGDKELYLDPGTQFCPFGVIPWEDTSAMGLRMDKNPPDFAATPDPEAGNAGISRRANLKLDSDGSIQGTVEVTFTGQEAMDRRLEERNGDDAAHKKDMEDLLRQWMTANAAVELQKVNDWKSSNLPLVATYQVSISGYAAATGRLMILPAAVFAGAYRNPFVPARRENMVIFPYPYVHSDDITISLPPGVQVESLPKPKSQKNGAGEFSAEFRNENGALHATRRFRSDGVVIESKYYPALRRFFGQVGTTEDEQIVLKASAN
jgi:hypothetical protein